MGISRFMKRFHQSVCGTTLRTTILRSLSGFARKTYEATLRAESRDAAPQSTRGSSLPFSGSGLRHSLNTAILIDFKHRDTKVLNE
jgi:hypothetical protein